MSGNDNEKSSITLEFNDERGVLTATVRHIKNDKRITADDITNEINSCGHGELFVLEEALQHISNSQSKQNSQVTVVVAERRDGQASVSVADDHMQACLTIIKAYGGEPVTMDYVEEVIRKQFITYGIKKDVIQQAVDLQQADDLLIAEGEAEINGEDTQFISLIPEITSRSPKLNDDGTVNLRELNNFVTVSKGDALMRKTEPTQGKAGTDILGKVVRPQGGRSFDFSPGLKGADIDADDPDLLIADTGGQPVLVEHGVNVEPVIKVKKVDISTGNIKFDGTVEVDGDVIAGMKILASADIYVSGTVEAAELCAGGDIVVKQGVIGRGELRNEAGKLSDSAAVLEAGHTIQAKFVENAWLIAGESISVQDLVSHSELYSLNQVIVGKKNASHGNIIGGLVQTGLLVEAQTLGSQGSIKTHIEVGASPELRKALASAKKNLAIKETERKKALLLLEHLQKNQPQQHAELLKQTLMTIHQLDLNVNQYFEKCESYEIQIDKLSQAKITVHAKTFNNVNVKVGNLGRDINNELGPGTFHLEENEIIYD